MAAAVADHTERLQLAGGFRDPFTTHPEHIGNQLLSHDQLITEAVER